MLILLEKEEIRTNSTYVFFSTDDIVSVCLQHTQPTAQCSWRGFSYRRSRRASATARHHVYILVGMDMLTLK